MKFSSKKIQLGSSVEFGEYQISQTIGPPIQRPLHRKVTVIQAYPEPRDKQEMKCFLGMCAQFSKYFPDLSHMTKPFKEQLKKLIDYHFGDVEKHPFDNIKEAITARMQIVTYDPAKQTRIFHDAFETGLAYMVQQKHDEEPCWCQ